MDIKVEPSDYESSHKFYHNPLTEALWVCSLDSGHDDEAGTTDDIGWHALFHFESDERVTVFEGDGVNSDPPVYVTVPKGSYILVQSSSGAVDHSSYPLEGSEVSKDWQSIADAYMEVEDEAVW